MTKLSQADQNIIDLSNQTGSIELATDLLNRWNLIHKFNTVYNKKREARAYILQNDGSGELYSIFVTNEEEKKTKYNQNVKEKENIPHISISLEELSKIRALKDSPHSLDQLIYLLYVSGRRLNEVISSTFEIVNDNYLQSYELSKGAFGKDHSFPIIIPTKDFISRLETLRLFNYSPQYFEVHGNLRIKNILNRQDVTLHTLRKIYANLVATDVFSKQVALNHENPESTKFYDTVKFE